MQKSSDACIKCIINARYQERSNPQNSNIFKLPTFLLGVSFDFLGLFRYRLASQGSGKLFTVSFRMGAILCNWTSSRCTHINSPYSPICACMCQRGRRYMQKAAFPCAINGRISCCARSSSLCPPPGCVRSCYAIALHLRGLASHESNRQWTGQHEEVDQAERRSRAPRPRAGGSADLPEWSATPQLLGSSRGQMRGSSRSRFTIDTSSDQQHAQVASGDYSVVLLTCIISLSTAHL